MKNIHTIILVLLMGNILNAQIGINTANPLATLEVHKSLSSKVPEGIIPPRITADSLQLKDHLYGPAQNGALIYITKPVSKISNRTQQVTSSGYYVYDAEYSNQDKSKGIWKKMFSDPNAFAASSISTVSFNSLLINSSKLNFQAIKFDSSIENEIGSEYITDNQYVVSETGLYVINYYIKFDNINNRMVSNLPSVAIVKSNSDTSNGVIMSSRMFEGIIADSSKTNKSLLSSQAGINHIYNLTKGDKLNFGLITDNDSPLSFGDASTEISIYKIR